MSRVKLDARRLLCPMPVIRVQDKVKMLPTGTELVAICTDPGALIDIPAWCRINGHQVLETRTEVNEHYVVISVGKS